MRNVWSRAAVAIVLTPMALHGQTATPVAGVWKVTEIVSPAGEKNASPQPTIYIFAGRHYSHVSVTSAAPRPNHAGPGVTDAQRIEMWEPFSATAGTYDVSGTDLTIRPIVAKNPNAMRPGSFTTFEMVRDGRDIWLRATMANTGAIPSANANRFRLVRLE